MKQLYDEVNLENHLHAAFGLRVQIKSVVAKIPVGASSAATVFLTDKGLLFALIAARGGQNFGDVKKILNRMNLRAEQFLPPRADANYFDRVATAKFREVFPGREPKNERDTAFYKTLASYNPALVQIAEVTGSVIKQYDSDAVGRWRPAVKFAYRRIRTS
ncbi:hypothetical protein FWG95_04625 [Candidatus Saccharibacteria bacterium]|nr:hypothetical protein [Candidatus Saccharibacteria bacterium]